MKTPMRNLFAALVLLSALNLQPSTALAQGTAFTYQGRLNDGGIAASGNYDFRFRLASDALGNNFIGGPLLTNAVQVSGGLFTLTVDFGSGIFTGSNYWLQVDVKTNNAGSYTTLTPLQALTPTPYAVFANTASNLSGTLAAAQLNGALPSAQLSGTYSSAVTFSNAANSFSGNGGGLINMNAATLGGLSSANFWKANGNAGTSPASGNFVGTTDKQPLELRVNGERALRLEPEAFSQATLIAGSPYNTVGGGTVGATIGGGGATNALQTAYDLFIGLTEIIQFFAPAGSSNQISFSSDFATVAGGVGNFIGFASPNAVIGGGAGNQIGNYAGGSVIGAGVLNQIQTSNSILSVISGGISNVIGSGADLGVIAGGQMNTIQARTALGTIGGGLLNNATGDLGTVPGGDRNIATNHAFAAGHRAKADDEGAFVWADSTDSDFASTAANQFLIRAAGGVGIGTASPSRELEVQHAGDTEIGIKSTDVNGHLWTLQSSSVSGSANLDASFQIIDRTSGSSRLMIGTNGFVGIGTSNPTNKLHVNGGITCIALVQTSDRNAKENFAPIAPSEVLAKVASLPITTWNFKELRDGRHLGPMAQDFYAAFQLGGSDTTITAVDTEGVALAAIQGLNEKVESGKQKAEARIEKLEAENAELKDKLNELKKLINDKLNGGAQ